MGLQPKHFTSHSLFAIFSIPLQHTVSTETESTNSTGFGSLSGEVNVTKQSAYNVSFGESFIRFRGYMDSKNYI